LTVIPASIWAFDELRGLAEEFPVYQATVSAEPLTSVVAVAAGDGTRSGGCGAEMVVPDALVVVLALPEPKPNAASAACAFESVDDAVIEKLDALGVLSVTAPPSMLEGVEVPVIESIADNRLPTVPLAGLIL
jgi:hypothetical protein